MMSQTKKGTFSENDVMMYLALGLKHLRLMVLLICLSLSAGLAYYTYARPVYYSKALIRLRTLDRPLDTEKVFNDSNERAVREEIAASHIIERTARRFGVNALEREIKLKYVKKIQASVNSEHNVIIETWVYSQDWAEKWPEAMLQEYLLWRDEWRLERIKLTLTSFTQDMEELKKKMDEVFNSKFDFHQSNQMTEVMIQLNQYKEIPNEIQTIRHQLAFMDYTRDALQNTNRDSADKLALLAAWQQDTELTQAKTHQMISQISVGQVIPKEDPSGIIVIPSMVESPLKKPWEELDKERRRLLHQYEDLGRVYLPGHPKMLAVKKQLDAANKSLDLELEVELTAFNLDYAHLVDRQRELQAKLPAYEEVTRRYEKSVQDYAHFDSGQLAWSRMYADMSKRLDALDFGADKERAQLQYIGLIETPDRPVAPNRLKLAVYLLMFGLALAVSVPSLIEYLDSRVSDVEKVEETLRIRGLGVVPKVIDAPVEDAMLDQSTSKSDHHIQENFRLIRTNLIMNSATPAMPQVILITSSMPQEGKTVVAANLALSFARKGEKTLLVDADLRRGRLHRLFACQNKPGLSEVLAHNQPVAEACRVVGNGSINGNLTVLPCGKHIHSASELLDSTSFTKLIDELRQKYQRIIIDTPPVLGLSETSIIQRVADGVVLVIWSDYTPLRNVKTAIQTLQTNGAKFAGFVLNRLDFSALTNRYKYFYYSPYYYASYRPTEAPPAPPQLTAAE